MTHSTHPQPAIDQAAALHLDGFLARYRPATRAQYAHHLDHWHTWCTNHGIGLFDATRLHLEAYARHLRDDHGHKATSIHAAMSPIRTFYRLAHVDGLITRDPAAQAYIERAPAPEPRTSLSRLELIHWMATAQGISARHNALAHLLGHLALRASEAAAVQVEDYQGIDRGYRVLRLVGKGRKPATMPLTIPVLRALDAARGDRTTGALILGRHGQPITRHGVTELVATITRRAGIEKPVSPHVIRAASITAALDAGTPLRDVQDFARHADANTTRGYDRNRGSLDRHAAHVVSAFLAS